MYLKADTLDDLMRRVLKKLLAAHGRRVSSTRGISFEKTGVLLNLTNPRARVSRSFRRSQFFSCLGETAWYLAGSSSSNFITYYVPAYKTEKPAGTSTIPTAYGCRLFNFNGQDQIANVINLLSSNRSSRRAVAQIIDAGDIPSGYVPCTCTLQFMVRGGRLHVMTHMRSNDAYLGLPHDIFAFTMIQEIVARELGVEIGGYKHSVGSLHLYEKHIPDAQAYVDDGLQQSLAMPAMQLGSQWSAIREFLSIESRIRRKQRVDLDKTSLDEYWLNLARMLRIYRFYKDKDQRGINRHRIKLTSEFYDQYVETRQRTLEIATADTPLQRPLFEIVSSETD